MQVAECLTCTMILMYLGIINFVYILQYDNPKLELPPQYNTNPMTSF